MIKAVLDSGVLVSAFVTPKGISSELLHMAPQDFFKIYLCEEIFEEIKRVLLTYPHIREQYSYSNRQVAMFCQGLRDATNLVTKIPVIKVVANDPNDDMVVACAIKAKAQYIVTRDDDMLIIVKYKGIKIVTPEEFMEVLRGKYI
jgi:putative PIN family toxin of toxin-antitoxin system